MDKVDCWIPTSSHGGMHKVIGEAAGSWVKFTDYDQLRQQLAAALAERGRAVKLLGNSVSCVRDFAIARGKTGHAMTASYYHRMADEIAEVIGSRAAIAAGGEGDRHG